MKTLTLVPSVVLALFVAGCITNKDVGIESETGDDSSSDGSASSGGATSTASGNGTSTGMVGETESSSDSASETGLISGTGSSSDSASGTESGGEGTSSSTGGESVEQQICESQGGTWDQTSCGHYECGQPPECAAVIPGCDCGPFATFTKLGCTPLVECSLEFACGPELTCMAGGQFCSVFVPGVKGADTSYTCQETPDACLGGYDCECLLAEGEFGEEGSCMAGEDGTLTVTVVGA